MGGKPKKSTPADKRLKANKTVKPVSPFVPKPTKASGTNGK